MKIKLAIYTVTSVITGLLYSPFFITAWLLHAVARLLLGISYLGMLNFRYAKDIFKSFFRLERMRYE